jgi:anaerobic magnesium-protoporphyrin IX monomethyl ester cyclase
VKIALIFPPTCDPTAPYLAIPALTGFLRNHGVEVLPIDANVEAWEHLLSPARLEAIGARLEHRLRRLEKRPSLRHPEQLAYAALWRARADAASAPAGIDRALATMRGGAGDAFFDREAYGAAAGTLESAFRAVGAAYAPLEIDFTSFRTPFSMLDAGELARGAEAEQNPFHAYFVGSLRDRIAAFAPDVCGLSLAFPGQLVPGYAMAFALKGAFPELHLTAGGPALTQLIAKLDAAEAAAALGPFDTAVLFEGETALLELIREVERGGGPRGVVRGGFAASLDALPAPDFDGLPLERYLSPALVLPYDPTRGCYHGRCAFCHYGLAERGAAPYRERSAERVAGDLGRLAAAHGARIFHLSEDTIAPRHLSRVASALAGAPRVRFATDLRPEPALREEVCGEWAGAGLLAAALGVESASPRVLSLIGKGLDPGESERAIRNLAAAGVAVEVMCFTDFPTETRAEALETMDLLARRSDEIALFMCGVFDLVHGSAVARDPGAYGVEEIWSVAGDAFRTGIFYRERRRKTEADRGAIEAALDEVSSRYALRRYPFAGSLSTAHTLLWLDRNGPGAFRTGAVAPSGRGSPLEKRRGARARFDVERIAAVSDAAEARLWDRMIYELRSVSRAAYAEAARAVSPAAPSPCTIEIAPGVEPRRVPGRRRASARGS